MFQIYTDILIGFLFLSVSIEKNRHYSSLMHEGMDWCLFHNNNNKKAEIYNNKTTEAAIVP